MTRPIYKCQRCREQWPSPQITPGKAVITMKTCPKCGGKPEQVGRCGYPS